MSASKEYTNYMKTQADSIHRKVKFDECSKEEDSLKKVSDEKCARYDTILTLHGNFANKQVREVYYDYIKALGESFRAAVSKQDALKKLKEANMRYSDAKLSYLSSLKKE